MALQCFIDESSDQNTENFLVMAGFIAEQNVWADFDLDWREELNNQKKPFAHFKGKIFHGGRSKIDAEQFYRIIEKHISKAIVISCEVPAYRKFLDSNPFPKHILEARDSKKLQTPHLLMYRAFLEFCYDRRYMLDIDVPINLIFDSTRAYQDLCSGIFEYMFFSADYVGINKHHFGDTPEFRDDKKTPGLQAADLLALIVKNNLMEGMPLVNLPWQKNQKIDFLCCDVREQDFYKFISASKSAINESAFLEYKMKKNRPILGPVLIRCLSLSLGSRLTA